MDADTPLATSGAGLLLPRLGSSSSVAGGRESAAAGSPAPGRVRVRGRAAARRRRLLQLAAVAWTVAKVWQPSVEGKEGVEGTRRKPAALYIWVGWGWAGGHCSPRE